MGLILSVVKSALRKKKRGMPFEISVAPMIDVSTPEYRRFMRIVSPSSYVFSEMVVDTSLIHMSSSVLERKIGLPSAKCILQIGGSDPKQIAQAVKRAQALGYRLFNLNCGCPSDRVQSGSFGAVLMKTPERIAEIVQRVFSETGVVMSVKCRIGVDDVEDYASFKKMIEVIANSTPCKTFYVHARKCLLKGLSPAENRRIPPLRYEYVFRLKKEMPWLNVVLNGGIREIEEIQAVKGRLDGVMLGRKPMDDPMFFAEIEEKVLNNARISTMDAISTYLEQLKRRPHEREQFMQIDAHAPAMYSTPNRKRDHDPNALSNVRVLPGGEVEYLCRHIDLKPIEPVLHGKRGCKEYKREIARLARERVCVSSVVPIIQKYLDGSSPNTPNSEQIK
ncbi:tRNA-dihydrouridine synthase A [Nematocida major]|uniref:tRNA-dihydrouridine synthase A n=1 Tax=Nematocida major TaxID=1912982 RepID=UPI00200775F0|nr:tRNA-dihydrouridine synthase A [Nematocida major]KAH9385942.1 tRNA-dihydrouridine synthase A [Nematocida major]